MRDTCVVRFKTSVRALEVIGDLRVIVRQVQVFGLGFI